MSKIEWATISEDEFVTIKEVLKLAGTTQKDLADILGIGSEKINLYLKGKCKMRKELYDRMWQYLDFAKSPEYEEVIKIKKQIKKLEKECKELEKDLKDVR